MVQQRRGGAQVIIFHLLFPVPFFNLLVSLSLETAFAITLAVGLLPQRFAVRRHLTISLWIVSLFFLLPHLYNIGCQLLCLFPEDLSLFCTWTWGKKSYFFFFSVFFPLSPLIIVVGHLSGFSIFCIFPPLQFTLSVFPLSWNPQKLEDRWGGISCTLSLRVN